MTRPRAGTTGARYPIIVVPTAPRLGLESFADRGGLHPELVQRFVALGLLDAHRDANGALWFAANQLPALARIRRLRAGLQLNYAGLGLVIELLDRIQRLEDALRTQPAGRSQSSWT
ncbi:MAG: chaperone modulatory protein CbpM [Pseudonocardiales bacterium]|jgi:chaperone modulatory protein CbpM|nr:MerR family transcriptional regulator [Jatrophihabitans sp.]MDT4904272.1 chaperone modulatory protein CbpM [Pseudonocardiales bacterium]MDT4927234.1 chaperone modulatory protein CbpM [Pseudonocardiales bacterium]MDT4949230.1 chaperone modulatory protein CbpM [Pseudonocardiales bacterium]